MNQNLLHSDRSMIHHFWFIININCDVKIYLKWKVGHRGFGKWLILTQRFNYRFYVKFCKRKEWKMIHELFFRVQILEIAQLSKYETCVCVKPYHLFVQKTLTLKPNNLPHAQVWTHLPLIYIFLHLCNNKWSVMK